MNLYEHVKVLNRMYWINLFASVVYYIMHLMSSLTQNLSQNSGIYIENMNKKVVFFILPPKLITIILLF